MQNNKKERTSFKNLLLYVVITVFFIAIGIACIKFTIEKQQRTKDWPTVDAQITELIEIRKDEDKREYEVYISYKIGEETYTNVKINEFEGSTMELNAIIPVKYNPSNHGEAVYSTPKYNMVSFVVGIISIAIGTANPTGFIVSKVLKNKKIRKNTEAE